MGLIRASLKEFENLFTELEKRIKHNQAHELIQKLYIKIRLKNFTMRSIEKNATGLDAIELRALLQTICQRHNQPIRLLGLGVKLREAHNEAQFELLP